MPDGILPGLPTARILARYARAAGNEIGSGKFLSPTSSACLVANAFGFFLDGRAGELPTLPGARDWGWPPIALELEGEVRLPWSGGRHPSLDVLIETPTAIVGIEAKRYEPFRPKTAAPIADAYLRDVWGGAMAGYMAVRDSLRSGVAGFRHLDAAQLVKHALGLRTAGERLGKRPALYYLFAEPQGWPDGRMLPAAVMARHRAEIDRFAATVADGEVTFAAGSYGALLDGWIGRGTPAIAAHARAVATHFAPLRRDSKPQDTI